MMLNLDITRNQKLEILISIFKFWSEKKSAYIFVFCVHNVEFLNSHVIVFIDLEHLTVSSFPEEEE